MAEPPRRWDPRLYQIATLGGLLVYGLGWLGFDLPASHAVAILATVLLVQLAATRLTGLPVFDPKSALISGLSLCLLLRTNSLELVVLTATIAIASKFVLRFQGKHVFNPTNFALVAMMLLTGQVWVSPGQWGSAAVFGFLLASAGGLVVNRAARSDVTLTFLGAYAALLLGRSLWLGEPLSIPLHRLESGALVALRLLHDLGSEDHARLAGGACAVRDAGGGGRVGRPVQALPDERTPVVARPLLAGRPADRPAASGPPLHLGPPGRPPDQHERRTP